MICSICPRNCGADRSREFGFCGAGDEIKVARAAPHFWEEPPISGSRGSGAVFFSGCNLRCVYCQNEVISHGAFGREVGVDGLLRIFENLVNSGVHNINLVTPSHFAVKIARALEKFDSPVPVVYNTSSYEKAETLRCLDGLVDIYLPDLKYYDSSPALKYSGASDYFENASKAVLEMYRQTGDLVTDSEGIAVKGIIIRHMVLPGNISQAVKVFGWVRENLSPETYISVMRQYTPYGEAKNMSPIDREISVREYSIVREKISELGFTNVFYQKKSSVGEKFIPDFNLEGVDL
ncbi:MAG: radical SAM protein [Clostridia bacterium]|nr:radical SAM protein [Clostridia bacterium]